MKFHQEATMLGISLDFKDILLNYIGGLQYYLSHTIFMFDPNDLDKVYVQATHLEEKGKFVKDGKNKNASNNNNNTN